MQALVSRALMHHGARGSLIGFCVVCLRMPNGRVGRSNVALSRGLVRNVFVDAYRTSHIRWVA